MNKTRLIFLSMLVMFGFFVYRSIDRNLKKQPAKVETIFSNINDSAEYERVITPRQFNFPEDFGSHDTFKSEWWYYTGNVFDGNGRQFGYQLTFFRNALPTVVAQEVRSSAWATDQIYLAHFTLTDTENNRHYQFETMSRGAVGLAGAKTDPNFEVWLYDWSVEQIDLDTFKIHAEKDDISIELVLTDKKGVVLHGNMGLSQKGPQSGNASNYFSQTQLETDGKITIGEEDYSVYGFSWMDHEFGTSALGAGQIGWDWFSIQLDSNMEFMYFQIRDNEGNISPYSSGSFIGPDGIIENIGYGDVQLEVLDFWNTSDGYEYPSGWLIKSEKMKLELTVEPVMRDQENNFFFRYWEGSVKISGYIENEPVNGYGYVELTGYAQSMEDIF